MLFLSALFLVSAAMPMASAGCPSKGVTLSFTGSCTLANIQATLGCNLGSLGFTAADVKKACDATA
jgi:hypothetical protein